MRHGLWRYHYIAKRVRDSAGFRWWVEEETDRVYRHWHAVTSGYGRSAGYSNADAICRCAYRYARIKKIRLTVGAWNELCRLIARRSGMLHHTTMRSCLIEGCRDKSPILRREHYDERSLRERPRHSLREIERRASQIRQAALDRQQTEAERRDKQMMSLYQQLWDAEAQLREMNKAIRLAKDAYKEIYA